MNVNNTLDVVLTLTSQYQSIVAMKYHIFNTTPAVEVFVIDIRQAYEDC